MKMPFVSVVTGASGFIGRHLVAALLENGSEVYAVVRNAARAKTLLPKSERLHVLESTVGSDGAVSCGIPHGSDVMYHLAWSDSKPESRVDFGRQAKNIQMTLSYLRLAKESGVKKIVMAGSTKEYLYCGTPINKEARPTPGDAYGAVKVALRYLAGQFARQNGIAFNYAVITGIYAADRKDNNVIFYTIDRLLKGERPSVTRLEQLWDYVYIDDAVEALRLIGEKGIDGMLYAVGHGDNWTLANYVRIIHEKTDPSLPLGIGDVPYPSDIMPMSCMDLTDLTHDTGFVPKVSFEDGISRVISQMKMELAGK